MSLGRLGNALIRAAGSALSAACSCCFTCRTDADCPQGYKCVNGKCVRDSSVPCSSDAECPAGYVCVDGTCVSHADACLLCKSDEVCIEGKCYPLDAHYCCWDSDNETDPDRTSTCQRGPCTGGSGDYRRQLIKSGPHNTAIECDRQCSRYTCRADSYECVPDENGVYASAEECQSQCRPPSDCSGECPPPFESGLRTDPYFLRTFSMPVYSVLVRVEYRAYAIPDRFQIWGEVMRFGQPAGYGTIHTDSGYRGEEWAKDEYCVDDPRVVIVGPGTGSMYWVKPEGTCWAAVSVIAPCESTGWEFTVTCEVNVAP